MTVSWGPSKSRLPRCAAELKNFCITFICLRHVLDTIAMMHMTEVALQTYLIIPLRSHLPTAGANIGSNLKSKVMTPCPP